MLGGLAVGEMYLGGESDSLVQVFALSQLVRSQFTLSRSGNAFDLPKPGDAFDVAIAKIALAAPVLTLYVSDPEHPTAGALDLSWTTDRDPELNFLIKLGTASGDYDTTQTVAASLRSGTIYADSGVTYYIALVARDSLVEISDNSNEVVGQPQSGH